MRAWLRELREQRRMQQKEIAKRARISNPFYSDIENGKRNPSVATAKKIADILEFDWTRFFEGE